LAAHKATMKLQ